MLLALAGLKRLGLEARATAPLDFLPALAQGAIGIETREDDARARDAAAALNDKDTAAALACERAFQAALGGSCRSPMAGLARIEDGRVVFDGEVLAPDGRRSCRDPCRKPALDDAARRGTRGGRKHPRCASAWLDLFTMRVLITRPGEDVRRAPLPSSRGSVTKASRCRCSMCASMTATRSRSMISSRCLTTSANFGVRALARRTARRRDVALSRWGRRPRRRPRLSASPTSAMRRAIRRLLAAAVAGWAAPSGGALLHVKSAPKPMARSRRC